MNTEQDLQPAPEKPVRSGGVLSGRVVLLACLTIALLCSLAAVLLNKSLWRSPAAPAEVVWGATPSPIRVVSYNILHNQRGQDRVVAEISKFKPDFVLLQEVESRDVRPLASALDMTQHLQGQAYQRSVNLDGPRSTWGNLILSKHPLYECDSMPNPGGGSFGVWAVSVIDGRKFMLACVHLSATWNANPAHIKQSGEARWKELSNLHDAWLKHGSPPIIVGGDFNQIPVGNNYELMTRDWTDVLAALGKTEHTFESGTLIRTRIDYFLTSNHWRAIDAGVDRSDASDHSLIWADFASAH